MPPAIAVTVVVFVAPAALTATTVVSLPSWPSSSSLPASLPSSSPSLSQLPPLLPSLLLLPLPSLSLLLPTPPPQPLLLPSPPPLALLFSATAAATTVIVVVVIVVIIFVVAIIIVFAVVVLVIIIIIIAIATVAAAVVAIITAAVAVTIATTTTARFCCSRCWLIVALLSANRFCHRTPSCNRQRSHCRPLFPPIIVHRRHCRRCRCRRAATASTATTIIKLAVVHCQRKRQQQQCHQRTNGSTNVKTFTSPDDLDLFNLSTVFEVCVCACPLVMRGLAVKHALISTSCPPNDIPFHTLLPVSTSALDPLGGLLDWFPTDSCILDVGLRGSCCWATPQPRTLSLQDVNTRALAQSIANHGTHTGMYYGWLESLPPNISSHPGMLAPPRYLLNVNSHEILSRV